MWFFIKRCLWHSNEDRVVNVVSDDGATWLRVRVRMRVCFFPFFEGDDGSYSTVWVCFLMGWRDGRKIIRVGGVVKLMG